MDLGVEIKHRRMQLGLTLDALAECTGVSRAMLSDVERGTKNPTIKVVLQIATGLHCTVSELLGEQSGVSAHSMRIVRQQERRVLVDPETGVERQLLAPAFQRRGLEVVWYVIPIGQRTGVLPPHPPGVEKHLTLVAGQMQCIVGTDQVTLQMGDALLFHADVEHECINTGTEACEYFMVMDARSSGGLT